jgi:ferredoxin
MYQLSQDSFLDGLIELNKNFPIIAPIQSNEKYYLKYFPPESWDKSNWYYADIRTPQPLKSFFYPPAEKVARYPKEEEQKAEYAARIIIGVKACDVYALNIIDRVYRDGEYPDPNYVKNRELNFIISSDCLDAADFCSCTLMNCKPYLDKEFDINIAPLNGQILFEVGSKKGEEFRQQYFASAKEATKAQIEKRDKNRAAIVEKLGQINQEFKYYQSHQHTVDRHLHSKEWHDLSKTCVECGICTQICPTCHCFLFYDQPNEDKFDRIKVWDSCFFAGYSRMAGGLTPRLSLADRFKNRFYHKFDSFVTNFEVEACTGCGRCSEGCMGEIDLRKVLLELEKRIVLKEIIDLV